MELTRRDALAALSAAGVAVGTAATLRWSDPPVAGDGPGTRDDGDGAGGDPATFRDRDRETLVAVAEAVYPSAVTGIDEFVETYVVGRARDDPDRIAGIADAVDLVDRNAREWYDAPVRDLSRDERTALFEEMGVDVADPDPEGIPAARVRYYLVNDLLYALYSSPTGGRLVGIENPQGHPGGIDSYRRGPTVGDPERGVDRPDPDDGGETNGPATDGEETNGPGSGGDGPGSGRDGSRSGRRDQR